MHETIKEREDWVVLYQNGKLYIKTEDRNATNHHESDSLDVYLVLRSQYVLKIYLYFKKSN